MERKRLLLLGIFLIALLLAMLIYVQYLKLQDVQDAQCYKLGLNNTNGGNCCFIDDNEEGLLPRYRAVPCDNLDYVPIEKQLNSRQLSEIKLKDLNLTVWKEIK